MLTAKIDSRSGLVRASWAIERLKRLEDMRFGADPSVEEIADVAEDAIVTIRLLEAELRARG